MHQQNQQAHRRVALGIVELEKPDQEAQEEEEREPREELVPYEYTAWGDVSGKVLDPTELLEARKLEMEYYKSMGKVPAEECWEKTRKAPWKARWIGVASGFWYRSRSAAKQFKDSDVEATCFVTTPVEAPRLVVPLATTRTTTQG